MLVRILWLLPFVVSILSSIAFARPGGGHSFGGGGGYSGGGGGYSGGGSGGTGGGDAIFMLIRLFFYLPWQGQLVVLIILAWVFYQWAKDRKQQAAVIADFHPHRPRINPTENLSKIRDRDPNFSTVVFEDFVAGLYHELHLRSGDENALAQLSGYVEAGALNEMRDRYQFGKMQSVILGAIHYRQVDISAERVYIELNISGNHNYSDGDHIRQFYVEEYWALERRLGVNSKAPNESRQLECPNCGAGLEGWIENKCSYCDAIGSRGAFDWTLVKLNSITRRPLQGELFGHRDEIGTFDMTIVDTSASQNFLALCERDPNMNFHALKERVNMMVLLLNDAWSKQDLAPARPFLSDQMFASWTSWLDAYKRHGLKNITNEVEVVDVHLARVISDNFFDSVTLRVFIRSTDHTEDSAGRIVAGSPRKMIKYSEYWTLIRSIDTQGSPGTDQGCPNCGAELSINMAGDCGSCDAHISAGEFDWVLSRQEQDEVYR